MSVNAVIVGSKSFRSSDGGITWTLISNVTAARSVWYNGSRWVVLRNKDANSSIMYSDDGITWLNSTNGGSFFTYPGVVKYYDGKWVAVGDGPSNVIYSTDGITWTSAVTLFYTNSATYALTYSNGTWIAGISYGANGTTTNRIAKSTNGINWTVVTNTALINDSIGYLESNGQLQIITV
jgi:hypothetical protein